MKKKKLLSLLLATSMVVTGSVGTYMGQVIYKTTAKAYDEKGQTGEEDKECEIDYGNMKFKCYFHHSYEQRITQTYQPAVTSAAYQPALYNWERTYINVNIKMYKSSKIIMYIFPNFQFLYDPSIYKIFRIS
jgi:hypothetical protein